MRFIVGLFPNTRLDKTSAQLHYRGNKKRQPWGGGANGPCPLSPDCMWRVKNPSLVTLLFFISHLTDALRIQPWSQDRRNQTKPKKNKPRTRSGTKTQGKQTGRKWTRKIASKKDRRQEGTQKRHTNKKNKNQKHKTNAKETNKRLSHRNAPRANLLLI